MSEFVQRCKLAVNGVLRPLGIQISMLQRGVSDLHVYEETERPEVPRYVNIGAGAFYHPYWHNLDNPNRYYQDVQGDNLHVRYDLTSHQPMPFEDASLKVAYTSHVIEHISDEDAAYLFGEVYRCLEPGGYFRITCPDMELEYGAYQRGDIGFWRWPNAYGLYNESIEQRFLDHFATALTQTHPSKHTLRLSDEEVRRIFSTMPKEEAFDYVISRLPEEVQKDHYGDHINWFSPEKVMWMLGDVGFSEVYESRYGQSHCPVLRNTVLFDSTVPELSLYVECRR
ncbi:MAG: methyltransferase domain-containing protein [Coriobacteriia bacterium]|nr:methyltransferase domain-containing protein [Coriobacteriia bacterium]